MKLKEEKNALAEAKKEKSLISHRPSCRAVTAAADLQAIKKTTQKQDQSMKARKKDL